MLSRDLAATHRAAQLAIGGLVPTTGPQLLVSPVRRKHLVSALADEAGQLIQHCCVVAACRIPVFELWWWHCRAGSAGGGGAVARQV